MTTFTPPSIEELQENFPQYKIERFIAQGGMGAVYLARQISLDRPVAIKILPDEFGEDADYRASFETEAKAMARLNHSNLVGIFDFGEINDMLFIVMEYIPGRSLFDTANGKQVEEKEAARLIADMSEGLAHAHDAGMLHRDIKPANVLIDDEARPKIVDFGLARPMGEKQTDGVVFGTPGYTAPEVLSNPYAVDHRSDIFSMGVMLYELLTGKLPGTPVVPASRITDTDPRFDGIIAKSIHPNPAMRYKSADKLSSDLDELINTFDKPKEETPKGSPLLASKRPVTAIPRSMGGASSVRGSVRGSTAVALPSAKKSQTGLIVMILLLLAVGGVVAVKLMSTGNSGPSQEEQARIAAAAKKKEKREKELQQQKERKAAAQRKRQQALDAKKRREEDRLAKLEDEQAEIDREERAEQERERKEQERIEAEKAAMAAKQNEAKKVEEPVSEFDAEAFLETERGLVLKKLEDIDVRADRILEPVFDKMERELKRQARKYAKGKKGKIAKKMVAKYMESVREEGNIIPLPNGVHKDLKNGIDDILLDYQMKRDTAVKHLTEEKSTVRKEYVKMLQEKHSELEKLKDEDGAAALDSEIEGSKDLESFLKLLSGDEEE